MDEAHKLFIKGETYENEGNYEEAFRCYTNANQIRKMDLDYNVEQDQRLFEKVKASQPYLKDNALRTTMSNVVPVFVFGLPRSGTTLVDQIITSHSKVTGLGEVELVLDYGQELITGCEGSVESFRNLYMSDAINLSWGVSSYITDKLCFNFLAIPLLAAAFPNAKFVHVKRDRMATIWSAYKRYFPSNKVGYSHDLKDSQVYYDLYLDLMKHWGSLYSIYTVNYEKLTKRQADETRKLIKYVGLDWEEACLYPHKNTREVYTYSSEQVRKPVYQGSSEDWKKFRNLIVDNS